MFRSRLDIGGIKEPLGHRLLLLVASSRGFTWLGHVASRGVLGTVGSTARLLGNGPGRSVSRAEACRWRVLDDVRWFC